MERLHFILKLKYFFVSEILLTFKELIENNKLKPIIHLI